MNFFLSLYFFFLTLSLISPNLLFCYLNTPFLDYILDANKEDDSFIKVYEIETPHKSETSCANVLNGLAYLGEKCAVLGHIHSENKDLFYLKCLKNLDMISYIDKKNSPSAQALCLITPEKTRDSINNKLTIDPEIFRKIKLFHMNANQLNDIELLKTALDYAQKENAKISCDLSSVNLVKLYKNELLNLLPKYIDILFANEKEILELTHLPPQQACDFLATFCEVVVITMGYSGSWVKSGKIKFYTPSLKTNQIDNAGVGDVFLSGFLHGYLNNASLADCSWIGSYVASKALGKGGRKLNHSFWKEAVKALELEPSFCLSTKQR